MNIKEGIEKIIEKRNEKVPELEKRKERLNQLLSQVLEINSLKKGIIDNKDIGPEVKNSLQNVNTDSFSTKMYGLIKSYTETIDRFSRHEINIAVVGDARQGKSKLLQTISNLDNSVIPAFSSNDCTGTSSVIKNIPNVPLKADISFYTQLEMIKFVQDYLDTIFQNKTIQLRSFDDIGSLSVSELKSKLELGTDKTGKFEHLKKYIEHFDEWKNYVNSRNITITDPHEIQKFVAQHNDEDEKSEERENYYIYLAVKEAVISCEFKNPETGSIVLRDTIGLGDIALGIEDKMLDTIKSHSDAAIIVRRPETSIGKLERRDEELYKKLRENFNKRNMDKWLFWLINRTTSDSVYRDNYDRCLAFLSKLDEYEWSLAKGEIVNVSDDDEVNGKFLPSVLETLIKNIDIIDSGILMEINKLADETYAEFKCIQESIKDVLKQGACAIVETDDFLDNKWDEVYESGVMKKLKDYRNELYNIRNDECEEFKNKVTEILHNSPKLLPTEDELLNQLKKGGNNRGIDVYTKRLDHLRTEFTKQFIGIDEEIFDEKVKNFKSDVINIFTSDDGGKFENLLSLSDYNSPDEWFYDFTNKYLTKEKYEQFNVAFTMLADFKMSVRGFLMHRIRDRIDRLDPKVYKAEEKSIEDEARKIYLTLSKLLKDVREELMIKFEDELYREPNRVFYSIIGEFYDRINFSYQVSVRNAENTWKSFYKEHITEIWSEEIQKDKKVQILYKDWSEKTEMLSKVSKDCFYIS